MPNNTIRTEVVLEYRGRSWGTIQVRSEFYYRMPTRGMEVRPESLAAAVLGGSEPALEPEEVDPYAWLNEPLGACLTLFESTHAIPRLRQVLSLLWIPEDPRVVRTRIG